jgi:protein-disulfide isomerase
MRHMMVLSAVLLLFVGPTPATGAQKTCDTCAVPDGRVDPSPAPAVEVHEVTRVDGAIDRALAAGDRAAVAALVHAAMIEVGESGSITRREEFLGGIRPVSPLRQRTVTSAPREVRVFGDTAVVVAQKTRSSAGGGPASFRWYETNTYVKDGGDRWLLAVSQSSTDPPDYSAPDVAFDLPFDEAQALGDRKAPVVVVEFSDYECPFCRMFAAETLPRLKSEYIDTGRVALVFRDQPLDVHPQAFAAATAGQCAAQQGKLWSMNERLLRDPMALSAEDLARNAREIGLDAAAFDRCLQHPATAARIRRDLEEAAALGVRSAPMFVIGVRKPGETKVRGLRLIEGAFPYEVFKATLDGVLRAHGR